MIKNKKAQIFTFIAIAILGLFFVGSEIYLKVQDRTAIDTRINTMNSFLISLEKDLQRQMYISGYRMILIAETDLSTKRCLTSPDGSCIAGDNLQEFVEAHFLDENAIDNNNLMFGARRIDLFENNDDSIYKRAEEMNIEIDTCPLSSPPEGVSPGPTSCYHIKITQDDPWNIKITFVFNLIIKDESNLASWVKKENIITKIPIESFYDPLYIRNVHDFGVKINQTIYADNNGNILEANLFNEMEQGYYVQNNDAPSFLMRLQDSASTDKCEMKNPDGSSNPEGCGIEMLIDKRKRF